MRLLITRPEADGAKTARALRARGHSVIMSPMLVIAPVDGVSLPESAGKEPGGVIITSRNALDALVSSPVLDKVRGLPCHFVGEQTAVLGRELGLATGGVVASTADELGDALVAATSSGPSIRRDGGPLVHLSGDVVASDLTGRLNAHGIAAIRVAVYRSVAASDLSAAAKDALATRTLDAVLLYSPRTAAVFADLVAKARLSDALEGVIAACLSNRVADALRSIESKMRRVAVAEKPNGKEMLALIDRLAAQLRP